MTSQVLRAVATKIALRQLPHTMTEKEIIEYIVDSNKSLYEWADKEYKHDLIV